MHSQPRSSVAGRRRAEEQFKTKKKVDSTDTPAQQAEAEKTARLRALRLAKEAADKETANRKRGGSGGRSICAAPTRFGWTSGFKSVRTQVRVQRRPQLEKAQSAYQRLLLLNTRRRTQRLGVYTRLEA
jgi:hypothetical protein